MPSVQGRFAVQLIFDVYGRLQSHWLAMVTPTHSPLPMAPGKSPFHTKGHVYTGTLGYLKHAVPGSLPALYEHLEPDVATFFEQIFLASGWYDNLPMAPLVEVAAQMLRKSPYDLVADMSRERGQEDIRGIHKLLLRVSSPEQVAVRLPRLTMRYFDWGSVDVQPEGRNRVRGVRTTVPELLVDWYFAATSGYLEAALPHAGARNVRTSLDVGPEESAHGLPTRTIHVIIEWD